MKAIRTGQSAQQAQTEKYVKEESSAILNLYLNPPQKLSDGDDSISLRDFQQWAIDRFSVLQFIDQKCGLDQGFNAISASFERKQAVERMLEDKGLKYGKYEGLSAKEVKEKDEVSHFILRLIFSPTREKADWFLKQECRLFHYRMEDAGPETRTLLQKQNINFEPATDIPREFDDFFKGLYGSKTVYKMPFQDCLSLVAKRKVAVRDGVAYVSDRDASVIIMSKFRAYISDSIQKIQGSTRAQVDFFDDPRISGFAKHLSSIYVGADMSADKADDFERLSLSNIETVHKKSFPPCMRYLYTHLRADHHLKHWGRLQLRLFFKGCGMTLDEQLAHWKSLFTKIDSDKFDKEHGYNMRHAYGKEGKRADYTPWPCSRILSGSFPPNPGPGDCHGCPFKHFDHHALGRYLTEEYQVPESSVNQILELKKANHFQLACVEHFKATHPGSEGEGVGNHPNAYFKESRRYMEAKTKKTDVKMEDAAPPA